MAPARKAFTPSPARDLAKDMAAAQVLKAQLYDLYGEEATDLILLQDMIEGETNLFETIDKVLLQIWHDEAMVAGIDRQESTLAARKQRFQKRVETLRIMLLNAMDIIGDRSIERPLARLTAKPTPPKLTIINEAEIPSEYWTAQDPKLDNRALTDALKSRRDTLQQKLDELAAQVAAGEIAEADAPDLRARLLAAFPAVPGCELSNGGLTIAIKST